MIVKNKDQRVAVLVDVQNLYYSAKNHFSSRINFRNLLSIALENRTLIRAIAYVIKADEREIEFFDAVNNAGFEIKEKGIQIFPDGSKKGDWDVGITMDAVRFGEKVDSIVLVSGDGDYIPVVTYLQQRFGCLVEVIAFTKTCSHKLKEIADDFIAIEDHKDSLLFRIKRNTKTRDNRKTSQKKYANKATDAASDSKASEPKSTSPISKLKKLFKKES